MKTNQEYKNMALAALKGNWAPAVLCAVLYTVIACATSPGFIFILLVSYPLGVGYYNAHKNLLLTGNDALTSEMFRIGFNNWAHNMWGMFLMTIYAMLWMLLLVVPGIIKLLAYSMTPYILVDKPELSAKEAICLSQKMMKGHKWEFFCLSLSFAGWYVLGILTIGIGFFWVMPNIYTTCAAYYQDIKAEYEAGTNSNN